MAAVIGKVAVTRHFRFPLRYSYLFKVYRGYSVLTTQAIKYNLYNYNQCCCGISTALRRINKLYSQVRAMSALSPQDPSSYSRPELAVIKHIELAYSVDFEKKVLNGTAELNFEILEDINELILDSSNLTIKSIELPDGTPLKYELDDGIPNYGSKLTIFLASNATSGEKSKLNYEENEIFKNVSINSKMSTSLCESFQSKCDVLKEISFTEDSKVYESDESDHVLTRCICVIQIGSHSEEHTTLHSGIKVTIKYSTSPSATALQWLNPNQTSGKKHPYLFSQCQPIHARSILPCQDTPAVKFTYNAAVTAPEEFAVLMSAVRDEVLGTKTTFFQRVPIPSYLLAIAVGVLEYRELGPRTKVWSEKEEIERSAWEFAETDKYMKAVERICGGYQWSQYDLLVLPPSFPYGGMENPCLTFVTPTLLAGDRSQADVIIHEIVHSWTGNLVTNRNFEHFWLNEGFTVFLERKAAASLINDTVEARHSRDFHSLLGLQELRETVYTHIGATNPLTKLVPNLTGIHPDEAFSSIPYEKGALFLRYLEDKVGGPEVFDDFIRTYINTFQKQSVDSNQFKKFIIDYFSETDVLKNVDWNSWFYKTGMPPVIPDYDTTMTKAVTALENKILTEDAAPSYDDVKTFTPHQMINLLQNFIDREPLPLDKVRALGEAYKLTTNKNSEIVYRWLRMCIRSRDETKLDEVFSFVNSQGRMKYVRPIYRDLYLWGAMRERAIENFLKNEPNMMHVSAYTLRKDLHLNK